MSREIHNEMAKKAYEAVSELKEGEKKEFRSLARSFPSMLQVNGLGGAIAFLYSKKNNEPYEALYNIINNWLEKQFKIGKNDLMKCITNLDSVRYRIYTDEVMKLSLWVKRFAEGMIAEEKISEPAQKEQQYEKR